MVITIVSNQQDGGCVGTRWRAFAACIVAVSFPLAAFAVGSGAAPVSGGSPFSYQSGAASGMSAGGGPLSPGTSLLGCSLDLPSGSDRNAGLGSQYLSDQRGRTSLIAPTLGVSEVYSDNVTLAPKGHESQDFVTDLMPGLTVCQSTPHLSGHFNYQMNSLYYAEDQSLNSVVNQFNGAMTAVVVPNHLFFNASTDYGLAVINPSRPYSLTPALDASNRTNAWTFSLSPYFIQPIGPLGITITRYTYDRAIYNDPRIPAFFSNSGSFNLINPPHNGNWSWDAAYETAQLVRQGNYRTNYIDTASLLLGYKVAADLKLLAQGGVEDRYLPDGSIHRLRSPFWNAGFKWSNGISSLELRVGHRFFGNSFYGRLEHQGKHLVVSVSYSEAPGISGLNNMGSGLYGMPGTTGIPGYSVSANSSPPQSLVPLSSLSDNRIYLSKSLVGTISYRTGRSRIQIDGYRIRERYLQFNTVFTTTQQDVTGGDAYWRWQWQPRLYLIPRFQFEKQRYSGGQSDYLTSEYLSLALLMSPTMQAGVTVEHQQRMDSIPSSSYQENAVILEVIKVF